MSLKHIKALRSHKPQAEVTMAPHPSRRAFLTQTAALATAGACIPPVLAATEQRPKRQAAATASGSCLEIQFPMKDVAGKVAYITGGSSGIGLGIARAFADAGMKVAVGYLREEQLKDAMNELKGAGDRVHPIRADVTNRPELERAAAETVKHFGKVHVIVANAGVQNPAPLGALSYEDWDKLMRVNVDGVFNTIHAFLPHIKSHGEGGQVVTTGSILGLFTVGGGYSAYCASKFAVVAMMESLRSELAEANIGVSAFCPGVVKSNLEKGLKDVPFASEPLEIGQLVLSGIRRNDLYILTHPEFAPVISARHEALMASIPPDLHPSKERIDVARSVSESSLYVVERGRQRCLRAAQSSG